MKNYLDYFIPKYLNTPGPLPEIEERNGIYYINGQVVGEKPVSGTDPIGQLWVEGAILGKPFELGLKGLGLLGKASWKGLSKVAPKATDIIETEIKGIGSKITEKVKKAKTFGKQSTFNSNNEIILIPKGSMSYPSIRTVTVKGSDGNLYELPEYAYPNKNPDLALELTQQRLEDGGSQRLKQTILEGSPDEIEKWKRATLVKEGNNVEFYDDYSAIREPVIVQSSDYINRTLGTSHAPENLGGALPQYTYWIYSDAPKNLPGTSGIAHEFAHYYHTPLKLPEVNKAFIEGLKKTYGEEGARYFLNLNGTEISARGTQLKNYFDLKEGQEITPEMWEYAKRNYVRDMGYDNNMSEFFELPKEGELSEFLNWINKNAPVVAVPTLIGTTKSGSTYKYLKGNKLRQIAPYINKEEFNKLFKILKK